MAGVYKGLRHAGGRYRRQMGTVLTFELQLENVWGLF
jgi:hypothetical protein